MSKVKLSEIFSVTFFKRSFSDKQRKLSENKPSEIFSSEILWPKLIDFIVVQDLTTRVTSNLYVAMVTGDEKRTIFANFHGF